MKVRLSTINYFYILLAVIWLPFQKGILIIDGAARSLIVFTILILVINLTNKMSRSLIFSKPISIWCILIIFSAGNLYLKGYTGESTIVEFIILQLILPFNVLFLTTREIIVNKFKTVSFIFKVFLLHFFLSVIAYGSSLLDTSLRHEDSFVNILALNIIFLLFFGVLCYLHKILKIKIVLLIVPITIFIISVMQTRKALGATLIFLFFSLFSRFKFTVSKLLKLSFLLIVFYIGANYLLENSKIGERFKEIKTIGYKSNTTDIEALDFLGDRAYFYVEGWRLFKKNPITGIGLTNFINQSEYNITIHSEHMVQLTENGIIGLLIYLIFYVILFKGLIRNIWNNKQETNYYTFLLGGLLGVILISFTAWIYPFPQYFVLFGVIIGYIKLADFEKKLKIKHNIT